MSQCDFMSKKLSKLRNITLSADATLIAKARERALREETTLNDAFRVWLEQFTRPVSSNEEYELLMEEMSGVLSGAKFSRDEANER